MESVGGFLICLVIVYYGLRVRILLDSMQFSKTFYSALRRRLDMTLFPFIGISASVLISMVLFITIPVFKQNQYIMVILILTSSQFISLFVLRSLSSTQDTETSHHLESEETQKSVSKSKVPSKKEFNQDISVIPSPSKIPPDSRYELSVQDPQIRSENSQLDHSIQFTESDTSRTPSIISKNLGLPPSASPSTNYNNFFLKKGSARLEENDCDDPERDMSITSSPIIILDSATKRNLLVPSSSEETLLQISSVDTARPTNKEHRDDWEVQ